MTLITTIAIHCPVTKRYLVIDVLENQETYMDYIDWELGYTPDPTDIKDINVGAIRNVTIDVTKSKFDELENKYVD